MFLIFMSVFQRSLLYLPKREIITKSFYSNTNLKKVDIYTSDGLILKSLFKKPDTKKNKTILVFHGNSGHIGHRVDKYKPYIDHGYGLLLLEYRGYGENKGQPTKSGLYRDAYSALDYLLNQNIKTNKIILYGESLGTAIATKLSTEYVFNSTILEAPFTSIAEIAKKHYFIIFAKYLLLDNYDVLKDIGKIKSPLLVIHGYKDNIINIKFGKKVFNAAPEPKQSIFIEHAGHNNLYEFNLIEKIKSFLLKY